MFEKFNAGCPADSFGRTPPPLSQQEINLMDPQQLREALSSMVAATSSTGDSQYKHQGTARSESPPLGQMDEDPFPTRQLHEPSTFSSGMLADHTEQNGLILAVDDRHLATEEHDPSTSRRANPVQINPSHNAQHTTHTVPLANIDP